MALYQDLGSRGPIYGISDATQQVNPYPGLLGTGWDVILDNNTLASNLTGCEIYHMYIDGPVGSSLTVMRDGHKWDAVAQGWQNGWDPSQPFPLGPSGQIGTIQFCWNVAFTSPPYGANNIQPQVTVWIRKPLS